MMNLQLFRVMIGSLTATLLTTTLLLTSIAQARFERGWYDRASDPDSIAAIAPSGSGHVLLSYHALATNEQMQTYLDRAQQAGARVIVEVPRAAVRYQQTEKLEAFITRFKDHPATIGWYTADEPSLQKWSVETMVAANQTIKKHSDKPVFIVFSYSEINTGQAQAYADAYDVLMVDAYPYRVGGPELTHNAWVNLIAKTNQIARQLDKPWWNVLQAMGQVPDRKDNPGWRFRLPTYAEAQFQLYWSLMNDAQGVLYWAYYRTLQTQASADEPYPGDGPQWFTEVYQPVREQASAVADVLQTGKHVEGIQGIPEKLYVRLYEDTTPGQYVLVILNRQDKPQAATLTMPLTLHVDQRIDSSQGKLIRTQGRSVRVDLAPWQVQLYRMTTSP